MGRWGVWPILVLALAGCAVNGKRAELADINYQLGVGYYRQGDYAMALEKLKKAEDLRPARVDVLMVEGLAYQALGRWAEAEAAFRRALELLEPDDEGDLPAARNLALAGDLHNNYGAFLCARGRYREAMDQFRAALAQPGYRTPEAAWENLGLCALRAGERATAQEALEKALVLDPNRPAGLVALARLRWEAGDADGAERLLARARALGPLGPEGLWLAIEMGRAQGRPTDQDERALRERHPGSPEAAQLRQTTRTTRP